MVQDKNTYNKMDLHQAADRGYGTVHLLRSSHLPDTRRNETDPFQLLPHSRSLPVLH